MNITIEILFYFEFVAQYDSIFFVKKYESLYFSFEAGHVVTDFSNLDKNHFTMGISIEI